MKKCSVLSLVCLWLLSLTCLDAKAAFVIIVGNSSGTIGPNGLSFKEGETVTLGVYGYNTATASIVSVRNIGMAFDIAAPGSVNNYDGRRILGGDSMFTDFAVSLAPGRSGSLPTIDSTENGFLDSDAVPGHDLFIDISLSDPISFGISGTPATAVHLANVSFKFSTAITGGNWGLKFVPDAQFNGGGDANSITGDLTMVAGPDSPVTNTLNLSVTVVPEPASLAVCSILAVIIRRRWTRGLAMCMERDNLAYQKLCCFI